MFYFAFATNIKRDFIALKQCSFRFDYQKQIISRALQNSLDLLRHNSKLFLYLEERTFKEKQKQRKLLSTFPHFLRLVLFCVPRTVVIAVSVKSFINR